MANQRRRLLGRPRSDPPRRLLFSAADPSEMPKSLAFEFHLIGLALEHNMNRVKQKICRGPAPSLCGEPLPSHLPGGSMNRSGWREALPTTPGWTGLRHLLYKRPLLGAQVAQLVEQRTENPCVGGSIPPLGTIKSSIKSLSYD